LICWLIKTFVLISVTKHFISVEVAVIIATLSIQSYGYNLLIILYYIKISCDTTVSCHFRQSSVDW